VFLSTTFQVLSLKHQVSIMTAKTMILVACFTSLTCLSAWQPALSAKLPVDPCTLVNQFIGTKHEGQLYPGATVPFGMVQLSPDTDRGGPNQPPFAGYSYLDNSLLGFSHTHFSGAGAGDLGDVLFAPTVGAVRLTSSAADQPVEGYRSRFKHSSESASPGYYAVTLDNPDIRVELTATSRVGMHRYKFPKTDQVNIIIDLNHGIGLSKVNNLELNIVGDHTVTGMRNTRGFVKDRQVYFVAEFSQPFSSFGLGDENNKPFPGLRRAVGKNARAWLRFNTKAGTPILSKVALSTTGIAGARKNMESELPGWDFQAVRAEAGRKWTEALSSIEVQGSPDVVRSFYSALYHAYLAPTLISDVDGLYRGADHNIHQAQGFENYSTFSMWDTFRAQHPLLTILQPAKVSDFIRSFQAQAEFDPDRMLPVWPLYGIEGYCMIGYHSLPVIAEAYEKGIRGFDAGALLNWMLLDCKRNDWWAERGYIPADKEDEAVSKTLEFSYDYYAVARLARALGKEAEAKEFFKRAQSWHNVYDPSTGFARGRLQDGSWRTPFDPDKHTTLNRDKVCDFTEGTSWIYSFFNLHNVQGLIDVMGGRDKFIARLDEFFAGKSNAQTLRRGKIGKYRHDNEPSHHVAYLYCYAGQPWKTQELVRKICKNAYRNAPDGLCGDDDCGQMSAWYVFSTLGFYPLNPVQGTYILGMPAFSRSAIKLPNGKTITITARGLKSGNQYVEKVLLNGKIHPRIYITHDELLSGGSLEFVLASKPGPDWGRKADSLPPDDSDRNLTPFR
jgi:predicted alpha-1,2-mannosidase